MPKDKRMQGVEVEHRGLVAGQHGERSGWDQSNI
jgi:hypothetical protein